MNATRRSSSDAVDIGDGWLEYLDDDTHRPYYMNQVTAEVTWNHPFPQSENRRLSQQPIPPLPEEGIFDDSDKEVVSEDAVLDGGIHLPPGWSEWSDSNGAAYYTHEDGRSVWTRPGRTDSQHEQQACIDSFGKDNVTQMRESSFDVAQTSSSANCALVQPVSESHAAFAQPHMPAPALPHVSDLLLKVVASQTITWSAGAAAHMHALLRPFPTVLSRLRATSHKMDPVFSGPQPVSFAWYTLGKTAAPPISAQSQQLHLDADLVDMGASLYYQSKGGLFKKSRTVEQRLSHEALPSSKPALQASKVAGESVAGLCRRCCVLVMLYMGEYQLNPSDDYKDPFKEKDNAISAASGSSRLVLIIREIFDIMRSSVQLADEAYARVLKQLCNNYVQSSVEAGWSLLLLMCSYVGCSDRMMRFLMLILNKCIVVERDIISRSVPNSWYAAHVVMLTLSHRNTSQANGHTLSSFVDAEVENSLRKLRLLSPLYSSIEEIMLLEKKFCPARSERPEMLEFVPSTLVLLTDLLHARGGFRTDGIFRLAGERSCVNRVRASISCRYPIVEADSDPLVLAEVCSSHSCVQCCWSSSHPYLFFSPPLSGAQTVDSRVPLPRHSSSTAWSMQGLCRQGAIRGAAHLPCQRVSLRSIHSA
jgi:hypothetical protein